MTIFKKRAELIELISKYLNNEETIDVLYAFAWDVIDCYCQENKKLNLLPYQEFENAFWYTIWQIQHLADSEHEQDGLTKKILLEALTYLQNEKKMPKNLKGERP